MRIAMLLVLLAAASASADETVLASGVVKKVEMGYQWVGWVKDNYSKSYTYAGVVPQLKVTLADGTQWGSCYNGPADPGDKCVTSASSAVGRAAQCSLVEYSSALGTAQDESNMPNLAVGTGNTGAPYGTGHQVTRKLNPLLAMLSMAGMKALPVQLKDLGGHPDFIQAKCFDSVVVCFGGNCN